jgi:hypothetical protein
MNSSDMDSSDTGSASETGSTSDPKATEKSEASVDETKASESGTENQSAMSPSDALADAVKQAAGNAKQRPGSSLILIPPVTRKGEGLHATASQGDEASASSSGKGFGRASAFGEGLRAQFNAKRGVMKDKWQRYAIPAALGFCLFGVGIATGGQFFSGAGKSAVFGAANPRLTQAALDQSEMRKVTKQLNDEIHALQIRVDAMRASTQSAAPDDIHGLRKSVDALRASLDTVKTETSTQITDLNAKIARLQHEEARGQPFDKSGRDEHAAAAAGGAAEMHAGLNPANANVIHPGTQASNNTTTIHPTAPATTGTTTQHAQHGDTQTALAGPPLPKDQVQPPSPDAKKKPQQMLVGWVIRDVYRGVALIDGPDGTIEVAKGDVIQGAGTVESIEHRNGGWVLVTNRGIVGSVRE